MTAQRIKVKMPDKDRLKRKSSSGASPNIYPKRNSSKIESKRKPALTPQQQKKKLQKVILARQIIGDALDQASNVQNESDQLAILKEGFREAIEIVPDKLKRNPKLYIRDVYKFQDEVIYRLSVNANGADNKQYEAMMGKLLDEIHTFENYAIRSGVSYIDDLVIVNKDNHILYPDVAHMKMYIKPYRDYLQKMYEQLRPKINL